MQTGFEAGAMTAGAQWRATAACVVAPHGSAWVAAAGFAPLVANPVGVLLLNAGDVLEGWSGAGELLCFGAEEAAGAARLAGLPTARPFAQPWLRLRTDEFLALRGLLRQGGGRAGAVAWLQRLLGSAPGEWRKRPLPRADAFEQRGRFDLAQAMCDHLDRHGRRNVPLAELESVFGLNAFHLLRTFRRETGLTPHRYTLQLRLRRTLLELEGRPPRLAALAASAGFSSPAHFSSAFRAAWGLSPREYAGQLPRARSPRL